MESQTPIARLRNVAGALAIAGTLALLSPGVSVEARADAGTENGRIVADGPACGGSQSESYEQTSVRLEQWMAMLRAAAAARQKPAADGEPVLLNNQGYRYGPSGPLPHPSQLLPESQPH